MKFSAYKANWYKFRLSPESKKQCWHEIQLIMSLIEERKLEEASILAQRVHSQVQYSCSLHPITHLVLAQIAFHNGEKRLFLNQCWLTIWAPLASFSRRLGADSRRRFFGLGPRRFAEQNRL